MELKIISIIIPILVGLAMFILRNLNSKIDKVDKRIDKQEDRLRNAITEQEVRRILEDKLSPIAEDISEVKGLVNTLLQRYMIK